MGQMLTDIAKETKSTVQQPLRRGQKRKAEISEGDTSADPTRYHITGYNGERDDEVRQGRRVYEIRGTKQVGYILYLQSPHMSGAGTIQMTEQKKTRIPGHEDLAEHTLNCLSTDKDEKDLWETLVDF